MSDARFVWATDADEVDRHLADLLAGDHSHKLWTDDYLAAVASAGGYSLATLDSKFARRYPELDVINPVEPASEPPEDGGEDAEEEGTAGSTVGFVGETTKEQERNR